VRALSLEYHDVVHPGQPDESGFPGPAPASYKLEDGEFVAHVDAISASVPRHSATAVELLQRADAVPSGLYFTFDDGGVSAITVIAGVLERAGYRGHFFVTTDRIGTPGFLSADQIRELVARGHNIGSHSCTHPPLMAQCSDEQLLREWRDSAAALSEILGAPVLTASVPGGLYHRRVGEAASAAGIRVLFNSKPVTAVTRVRETLVLGRYTVRPGMPAREAADIAMGRVTPRARQWVQRAVLTTARTIGGPLYLRLRAAIFARRAQRRG
jgi:peptidoglycan/xylan/chitin deacetylase (PgdA/CDA1 family)